ncbi:hypothetical protein ASPCAL05083 [Aspergillus calidoustus]|uniref:Thiamine pyrophosphate enzyme N-terminal TPP-binding domain-containing protein n=1 Tax=Aspergillus calidoustus TaxID=454130 RepID=A0A0U5FWT0_ASPCI|nr:hypothetical protein ASPCAL05083 [Aspergillus calidoustus]
MMVKHGVKHIFGYPGGAILPAFDAIHKALEFDFILPRHKKGAGRMVGGYSHAPGKPGVVLVTYGPAATNLIMSMMDALAEGTPMVAFCGQVATARVGLDAFQEANVLGMSQPYTKWDVSVRDVEELPTQSTRRLRLSRLVAPVQSWLSWLSIDVTASILRRPIPQSETYRPTTLGLAMGNIQRLELHRTLERAAHLNNTAKQPELYVGQGMLASLHGPHLLKKLADKASIPVTTSLQGLGAYDEHDPKALHMLGLNGSSYANLAMQNADLL